MNLKKLPMSDPPIKCFQFDAYPLSVLSNSQDYLPWFCSNYIQLCCKKELVKERVLFLEFYEHMQAFKSPWLQTQCLYWDTLSKLNIDLPEFFIEHIDLDYYIYAIVDEFYIPDRNAYGKHHFIHDIFIYGYDKEAQTFNCAGYNERRIYSYHTVRFSDFEKAFRSIDAGKHHVSTNDIYLIRRLNSAQYQFDFQLVKEQIHDYLYSANSSERDRRYMNPVNDKVFGMKTYEHLRLYLRLLADHKMAFDVRSFEILYEHKKCMAMRAKYMHENMGMDCGMQLHESYKTFEQKALFCRNMLMKYALREDAKLLEKAAYLLDELEGEEKAILRQILG